MDNLPRLGEKLPHSRGQYIFPTWSLEICPLNVWVWDFLENFVLYEIVEIGILFFWVPTSLSQVLSEPRVKAWRAKRGVRKNIGESRHPVASWE